MDVLDELGMTVGELRESLDASDAPRGSGRRRGRQGDVIGPATILREGLYLDEQLYEDVPGGRVSRRLTAREFRAQADELLTAAEESGFTVPTELASDLLEAADEWRARGRALIRLGAGASSPPTGRAARGATRPRSDPRRPLVSLLAQQQRQGVRDAAHRPDPR